MRMDGWLSESARAAYGTLGPDVLNPQWGKPPAPATAPTMKPVLQPAVSAVTQKAQRTMSLLSRLLGTAPDPREQLRPLWHRVVELAREPSFYAQCGVADTVAGRFDLITAVLCAVMVRVEASEMRTESALLAELFVEDMDGQLREFGVNDVVVGKRMGKLMSVLGGRLGAYRSALNTRDRDRMIAAVARNVTFSETAEPDASAAAVADKLLALSGRLAGFSDEELLKASGIW